MLWQRFRAFILFPSLFALAAIGCGSDDVDGEPGDDCPSGQQRNVLTGQCEPIAPVLDANNGSSDSSSSDAGTDSTGQDDASTFEDTGTDDTGSQDTGNSDTDNDVDQDPPACPDRDGEGAADEACGGQDCDDNNATVGPGAPEVCDEHDNNCDGQVNEGLDCSFYAHSNTTLYVVDPFEKTATQVTSVPHLFDMDTHPDGTLYGITSSALHKFEPSSSSWTLIGDLGVSGTPNGLAINNQGTAYMTASNDVYTVDLATGSATHVGSMGGSYNSSGDCVVNKDNSLYMSSDHNFSGDALVVIDGTTGQAQDVGLMGYSNVYGLTAAWGRMFGLTGSGQLIEINSGNGQATLVHTFSNISWYGAASTPQR